MDRLAGWLAGGGEVWQVVLWQTGTEMTFHACPPAGRPAGQVDPPSTLAVLLNPSPPHLEHLPRLPVAQPLPACHACLCLPACPGPCCRAR